MDIIKTRGTPQKWRESFPARAALSGRRLSSNSETRLLVWTMKPSCFVHTESVQTYICVRPKNGFVENYPDLVSLYICQLLVCVHPPSAHKWPNIVFDTSLTRFHKSYWTGNTQSLKIYFFCGRHCSLYESWSDEDNLSSGFGVGAPIVFKDRLLIYATVNHQTISLSYELPW